MTDSKEISIVIQGPINSYKKTQRLVLDLRKTFPQSQIILSTWQRKKKLKLIKALDVLVQSKMPRALNIQDAPGTRNVQRQIVSTFNGIKKAKKPFCLKIRTDLTLLKKQNLTLLNKKQLKKSKILIPFEYTRDPNLVANYKYHFSDILQFGRTSDLKKIWSCAKKANYLKNEKRIKGPVYSEQLIYIPFFKPKILKTFNFNKIQNFQDSEKILVENFLLAPLRKIGFRSDRLCVSFRNIFSCYSPLTFLLVRNACLSKKLGSKTAKIVLWITRKIIKRVDDICKPKIHGIR